jgi:site-specific DNA-methyltransferase (adenine-specific)
MSASFLDGRVIMHRGDCLAVMAEMPPDSVDAVVCDPPYHLTSIVKRFGSETAAPPKSGAATGVYKRTAAGFMGKQWDGGDVAFRPETWAAVLRVLKPGGHLLAFGGTRTYHRLACAIEDAGFEIRDQVGWLFGSGFPKSHDVSKAIDKAAGAEREVAARKKKLQSYGFVGNNVYGNGPEKDGVQLITAPATDDARRWQGWGTALKPAHEPICMARKPLSERTVAANVLKWGVGGLNIDGCRVEGQPKAFGNGTGRHGGQLAGGGENSHERGIWESQQGRWPANLLHDGSDLVLAGFPETPGQLAAVTGREPSTKTRNVLGLYNDRAAAEPRGDSGSAARFFYTAKADSGDRIGSRHPTVKPVDLIRYLCRLITPPGGTILDCFAGTGTTGEAAFLEGFNAVLIEREAEYQADIRRRMALVMAGPDEKAAAMVKAKGRAASAGPLFDEAAQ